MPKEGYTELVERILDHPGISLQLGQPLQRGMVRDFSHVFYSGPLDDYFGHDIGSTALSDARFRTIRIRR